MTRQRSKGWSRLRALAGAACVASCLLVGLPHAQAQSASDREGAATAFDRGTAAYLARDYEHAADWFEMAHSLAPSSAALIQAVRAWNRAGNLLRAASLALRIRALYPDDAAGTRTADEIITQATPLFARIDVTCSSECTVERDGALSGHTSFFVEPGTEHTVRASFETGAVSANVSGAAGETRSLAFDAPPPTVADASDTVGDSTEDDVPAPPPASGGISPAFFATGMVLTALAGGALVGAGIYTLDGVPAYEATPTAAGLADGQSRETLTNAMIGVTAGLAATTLLLAIFTDWDGDPASSEASSPSSPVVSASMNIAPDSTTFAVSGTF